MKNRGLKIMFAGIVAFLVFGAAGLTLDAWRWAYAGALVGWCVAAFGFGIFYRDFIRDVRANKARRRSQS